MCKLAHVIRYTVFVYLISVISMVLSSKNWPQQCSCCQRIPLVNVISPSSSIVVTESTQHRSHQIMDTIVPFNIIFKLEFTGQPMKQSSLVFSLRDYLSKFEVVQFSVHCWYSGALAVLAVCVGVIQAPMLNRGQGRTWPPQSSI